MLNSTRWNASIGDRAEALVDDWVLGEVEPPHKLAPLVSHYRELAVQGRTVIGPDADPIYAASNELYDILAAAAATVIAVSIKAEAQLRRAERKLTLTQRWDRAIQQWSMGVRV